MARIEAHDACVCDPPYGLEFLSQHVGWDKLDWRMETGFAGGGSDRFKNSPPLPSYSTTTAENRVCRVCKGTERGQDRKGFTRCRCDVPDFPERKVTSGMVGARLHAWHAVWLGAVYRALPPGGVVKAFGGTRVMHRLAQAMESVGFEGVRLEGWMYLNGFPKSLDMSKGIDRHLGGVRPVIGMSTRKSGIADANAGPQSRGTDWAWARHASVASHFPVTASATKEAALWEDWGTALKPAWEPVLVGYKP